ncbi:hypothetical protein HK099_008587 [Clydaea vesicula]|uniref:Eukaryotic translation initiation factor 4G1 eIF4E-binding domain-containing protein n=1 Tax=Clydaea vesicula TaxID=447962 RepID=A0AAD5XXQ4_9FUNG|nr:hypothetical protein HK099_008587 [Clydaea vesicula]KAJ3390197.1 hypothetical protein HDU92_000605 [Lobulomyces angularis]
MVMNSMKDLNIFATLQKDIAILSDSTNITYPQDVENPNILRNNEENAKLVYKRDFLLAFRPFVKYEIGFPDDVKSAKSPDLAISPPSRVDDADEGQWDTAISHKHKKDLKGFQFVCSDCKGNASLSAKEVEYFRQKGYKMPKKCKNCKVKARS